MPDTPPNPELLRSAGPARARIVRPVLGFARGVDRLRGHGDGGLVQAFSVSARCWPQPGCCSSACGNSARSKSRNALGGRRSTAPGSSGWSTFSSARSSTGGTRCRSQPFFTLVVVLLALSGLLFLFNLNLVLARLGDMLPDETLRQETRQFTAINRGLLVAVLLLAGAYVFLLQMPNLPVPLLLVMVRLDR